VHKIKSGTNSHSFHYKLQSIQYNQSDDNHRELKCHGDYLMLIIKSGTGTVTIGHGVHSLKMGSGFIIGHGEALIIQDDENISFYQLNIMEMEYEQSKIVSPLARSKGEINCTPHSICLELVESIYKQFDIENELIQFHNYIKLQELLLFIFKQNQLSTLERDVVKDLEESIEYIKQNYQQNLTVDALAEMTKISRWQYVKIFKKQTGQVPSQYLNQIRIDKAKELLIMTNNKLHTIAENIGYSNEYYFNRRFKQSVGITPGQYRRNHQKNIKVFAPFLEDFLLALGLTPVAQSFHKGWGKQNYLNLLQIPIVDIAAKDYLTVSNLKPDLIMVEDGMERWVSIAHYERLAPTYILPYPGEEWRMILRTIADLFGHVRQAETIIEQYESKAYEAKLLLQNVDETVACLRISAHKIILYAGSDYGFTGPILYKDLGLKQPMSVKHLAPKVRRTELSLEELSRLDADHLFITLDCEVQEQITLFNEPVWQSLLAVKRKQVYEVDFFTWMNYGVLSNLKKIDDVIKIFAER